MAPFVKKLLVGLGKAALAIVLVAGIFIGYVYYAEGSASRKAAEFCEATVIGSSVESLSARVAAAGAVERETQWIRRKGSAEVLPVTFHGVSPFSRHFCEVAVQGGVVSAREVGYLD